MQLCLVVCLKIQNSFWHFQLQNTQFGLNPNLIDQNDDQVNEAELKFK